ncbi:hypothetical protein LJ707_02455 [Mucilaginibacter sp. UR6-1]|uniref:hypothetical protein n=1 Tax=Mucilaginibacter sp. UR6-1 TaxID=1435643 RepID=UPI001E315939|nr:hypothetical protein [Mucilaginibacter sp. UR6-1]MCC8407774.1 hypothetical protein [Mucilaginibacter sp. UR6-1]
MPEQAVMPPSLKLLKRLSMRSTIHLKAPVSLTQKHLPLMDEGGRIINTSSGLACFSLPDHGAGAVWKRDGCVDPLPSVEWIDYQFNPGGSSGR